MKPPQQVAQLLKAMERVPTNELLVQAVYGCIAKDQSTTMLFVKHTGKQTAPANGRGCMKIKFRQAPET